MANVKDVIVLTIKYKPVPEYTKGTQLTGVVCMGLKNIINEKYNLSFV